MPMMVGASVINHTDAELVLLESLVGHHSVRGATDENGSTARLAFLVE